ncbi:MAG: phage tail tape measure protein [Paracoccaceae bacterium]
MEFDPSDRDFGRSLGEMRRDTASFAAEIGSATKAMRGMEQQAASLSRSIGSSLRTAFDRAVFGGAKLGEVFRGLASDVLGKTLDLAIKPVQSALSQGLASGVGSLIGAVTGAVGGATPFASGGVVQAGRAVPGASRPGRFDAGRVRAFARGGVVDRATFFPMRDGLGLMGEAGPEAILPLSRGPDGRLGVESSGGAAAGPVVNVTISTPDLESFSRSRGQVAAQLARAVSRGARRL